MASDSSSNEEDEKLKEAIDPNFLKQNLYCQNKILKNSEPNKRTQSSARSKLSLRTDSINPLTIKVTPEYRQYVSKHLSRILDESIEEKVVTETKKKKHKVFDGVKLLKNSKNYIKLESEVKNDQYQKRYFRKNKFEVPNFEERAKEVAVSGEWVLSQKDTENWAKINKGEIEVIKL